MGEADWFAGRLKELREGAGLSQTELAERAGLTRDGISHLEQGRRKPVWGTVIALSKALGVDCRAFLQAPAERGPQGPGRPAKDTTGRSGANRSKKSAK
ncbi:MAG: helix-turn-helix transcriptional regulator [Planctomycetia bacterium]|nr:helix-turn-helix transcriptional regulator [Planctomycetia bacterium]